VIGGTFNRAGSRAGQITEVRAREVIKMFTVECSSARSIVATAREGWTPSPGASLSMIESAYLSDAAPILSRSTWRRTPRIALRKGVHAVSRTILIRIFCVFLAVSGIHLVSAQSLTPAYLVVGDSMEFGLGDDIAADGMGCAPIVQTYLETFLQTRVALFNFGEPFAGTREMWRKQLPQALAVSSGHLPVVVSLGWRPIPSLGAGTPVGSDRRKLPA
jgi:hypothetical protein